MKKLQWALPGEKSSLWILSYSYAQLLSVQSISGSLQSKEDEGRHRTRCRGFTSGGQECSVVVASILYIPS